MKQEAQLETRCSVIKMIDMDGTIDRFLGCKIVASKSCCDYVQARKNKNRRINKKWLKKYGKKYVPYKGVVVANLCGDNVILCHPKYWDRFQQILKDIK